jgi:(1->4)-alpha-D-glucan 1-alpha-D-glucosylmutase
MAVPAAEASPSVAPVVRRASYRVQLGPAFGFADAADLLPHLQRLGISHLYLSPIFEARLGSTHGYDVVDPNRLRAELGGDEGFEHLVSACRSAGVGLMIDVVPNHLAASGRENRWWWEVLQLGPRAPSAQLFDIAWEGISERHRNRMLLPVLDDHLGRAIDAGVVRIEAHPSDVAIVRAGGLELPLAPSTIGRLVADAGAVSRHARMETAGRSLVRAAADESPSWLDDVRELIGIVAGDLAASAEATAGLGAVISDLNADVGRLDALLAEQYYRLARWRMASHELGYRRFFDINDLIAVRTDRPEVVETTHRLAFELVTNGLVDGLRIDHVDGLLDPARYLRTLRRRCPSTWVVVEKILTGAEQLPRWPVEGTTGYDALRRCQAVLVDPRGIEQLIVHYREVTGDRLAPDDHAVRARTEILSTTLASDVERLTERFVWAAESDRHHTDHTRAELRDVIVAFAARTPAYRSYVEANDDGVDAVRPEDVRFVDETAAAVERDLPHLDRDLVAFFRDILLLRVAGTPARALALRFQQLTGPATAKGEEDTAFYRSVAFLPFDEVGVHPGQPPLDPDDFHREQQQAQEQWPATLTASSTHDTKRSEDVRARLLVLSEDPDRWRQYVDDIAAALGDEHAAPDGHVLWFVLQTLVGAHPITHDRLWPAVQKGIREAKLSTNWLEPDESYEQSVDELICHLLDDERCREITEAFVAELVRPGRSNSLAMAALRWFGPGVPDVYQGSEVWTDSLVDPDNRRSPSWDRIAEVARAAEPIEDWASPDGAAKVALLRLALDLRGGDPPFAERPYRPVPVSGTGPVPAVAFQRGDDLVVVVRRFPMRCEAIPADTITEVPEGSWRNAVTGERSKGGPLPVVDVLSAWPVAVLVRE